MANIAISDLTKADALENDDLLLVSKKNGDTYTSYAIEGSKFGGGGTGTCGFSSDTIYRIFGVDPTGVTEVDSWNKALTECASKAAVKGVMLDYDQAFMISKDEKVVSDNFPFDAQINWKTGAAGTVFINGFDVHELSWINDTYHVANIRAGSKVEIKKYSEVAGRTFGVNIIPYAYGESGLTNVKFKLSDFLSGSPRYSEIKGMIGEGATINVYGSDTNGLFTPTQATTTTRLTNYADFSDCSYKFYGLVLQLDERVAGRFDGCAIGPGGYPKASVMYSSNYYTSGFNMAAVGKTIGNTYLNNITNGGKKAVVKPQETIAMSFQGYKGGTATMQTLNINKINNITLATVTDLTIS